MQQNYGQHTSSQQQHKTPDDVINNHYQHPLHKDQWNQIFAKFLGNPFLSYRWYYFYFVQKGSLNVLKTALNFLHKSQCILKSNHNAHFIDLLKYPYKKKDITCQCIVHWYTIQSNIKKKEIIYLCNTFFMLLPLWVTNNKRITLRAKKLS